ncbi:UNVERIFIED_CONTAM: hypothetical protein Sindi_0056600, partial [Sesamum indicum]
MDRTKTADKDRRWSRGPTLCGLSMLVITLTFIGLFLDGEGLCPIGIIEGVRAASFSLNADSSLLRNPSFLNYFAYNPLAISQSGSSSDRMVSTIPVVLFGPNPIRDAMYFILVINHENGDLFLVEFEASDWPFLSSSSSLTHTNVDLLHSKFHVPNDYIIVRPSPDDCLHLPPFECRTFFVPNFETRLRLPLHPLIKGILEVASIQNPTYPKFFWNHLCLRNFDGSF